jgi:hypothetical protein
LRQPLREYCGSIYFDVDDMVLRDASNGGWMRVDPNSDVSYFGDMFLKPNNRKKDGSMIFHIPNNVKPPVFGLVFNASVWKAVETFWEEKVGWYFSLL